MLDVGLCTQLACIWESTARKPGNVHRFRDFDDVTYLDFLMSAAAIAPVLATASQRRIGETVLAAVQATRLVVTTNTNLGIILLLTPLAAVSVEQELRAGVRWVLDSLDASDARSVYQAIRLAAPGGLGRAAEQDVAEEPTQTLREVMALAAERDLVARQYANGYREVFEEGVPALLRGLQRTQPLEAAIILCHLHLMATFPDSLIVRKCGLDVATEAAARARRVLDLDWPRSLPSLVSFIEFDHWLRSDGHQRNPGTTADLVTACLFVALREGNITVPTQFQWPAGAYHE